MRTQQTRPTPHAGGNATDPDCPRPWESFLSPARGRRRALTAAANAFLSQGHSAHFERNRKIRETHIQGRAVDIDRDDLSKVTTPRRYGRGQRQVLAPARLLDRDAWNSILGAVPTDFPNRDVLIASAQGRGAEIAAAVGISQRQVRNIQNQILAYVRAEIDAEEIARHLDDPITTEAVVRRPPSRAGRKPHVAAALVGVVVDLWGAHHQPLRRGRGPDRGPRRPRARPVCEGQLGFWDHLEAA